MAKRGVKHAKKSHKKGKSSKKMLTGRGMDTIVKPLITGMFDSLLTKLKPSNTKDQNKEYAKKMGSKLDADFRPSALIDKGFNVGELKQKAWDVLRIPNSLFPETAVTELKKGIIDSFKEYGFGYKRKGKKRASKK